MSWGYSTIGEHCLVTSSKRFHLSDRSKTGVPFYCSKEIIQKLKGEEISDCDYINEESYESVKMQYGVPVGGDLLITTRGTYGIPYIYRDTDKFYFADGNLTWLKDFDDELDVVFLYYWILSHEGQKKIDAIAKGTAQKAVPIASIKLIQIPLPPVETQHRIADILSAYDNLIENNRKQIKLLEEAAQRLYKEWFIDLRFPGYEETPIVDGIPQGWEKGELGDIAFDSGKREKKEHRERYSYYLPIDCLPKCSLAYTEKNDISLAESSLVGFLEKDILFGAMRPYFHKVVFARDKGLTRSTCFVVNAKEQSYWDYLLMLLFSKDTVDYATKISVGTTVPYVRWNDFKHMEVIIPTEEIAFAFHKRINPIVKRVSLLAISCEKLAEARDRLLPKLMSGEIEA